MFLSERSHSKNSLRRKQTIIPDRFLKVCRGLFILFDKLELVFIPNVALPVDKYRQ